MLTVAGLGKSFGGRELFDDVSLALQSGERVAVVVARPGRYPRRDSVPAVEAKMIQENPDFSPELFEGEQVEKQLAS